MRVVTRRALTVVKSRVLHVSLKQCFCSFLLSSFGPYFLKHDLGFYLHILVQCNSIVISCLSVCLLIVYYFIYLHCIILSLLSYTLSEVVFFNCYYFSHLYHLRYVTCTLPFELAPPHVLL